jgi:protein phosphatase
VLDIEFAQLSDPGLVREQNEDYLGYVLPQSPEQARSQGWLFALADGVGGQDRGEVASSIAVETLLCGFRKTSSGDALTTVLPRLVQASNAKVFEAGLASLHGQTNMATTVVACALRFDRAVVSHVGDSRCYLVRARHVAQLTRDHTVSGEQVRLGVLTAREAAHAQMSHVLTRSLGNDLFVSVDTGEHQVYSGDVLLLCSDGLHNCVFGEDMARIIHPGVKLHDAAGALVSLAKERDGGDNISVQLIRVRSVERVGMYRGRHYKIQ